MNMVDAASFYTTDIFRTFAVGQSSQRGECPLYMRLSTGMQSPIECANEARVIQDRYRVQTQRFERIALKVDMELLRFSGEVNSPGRLSHRIEVK